jgi:potassium efflux system protein
MDAGSVVAFETISFYALVVLSAVVALHLVNIPLTIFALAGGALAIGVGFGSQTIVKNFFSGLVLLIERPIQVGDVIQYDTTTGVVSKIGTRSTVIQTADQLEVIVPNSYLIENTLTNWTLSNNKVRRKINIGVAYGSPLREVGQVMLAQVEKHNLVLKDPQPDVIFAEFGDSALLFTLRFWVHVGTGIDASKVESDLRHMIDGAFREEGIEIAFPQRDMNLRSGTPLKIQIVGNE